MLDELRALDIAVTPPIIATLGINPADVGRGTFRPPPIERYRQAVLDLRAIRDDLRSGGDRPWWPTGPALFVALAGAVVLIGLGFVSRAGLSRRREALLRQAMDDALTDPLTGAANRRCLDRDLRGYAALDSPPVAAMMIDIDHFKAVNDEHGHVAGDDVLRAVGAVLAEQVRADDIVYRYGGEEFCVLLPGASPTDAHDIAERIRRSVTALEWPGDDPITVSIGIAQGSGAALGTTIERADRALYQAKRDGRNRTSTALSTV